MISIGDDDPAPVGMLEGRLGAVAPPPPARQGPMVTFCFCTCTITPTPAGLETETAPSVR